MAYISHIYMEISDYYVKCADWRLGFVCNSRIDAKCRFQSEHAARIDDFFCMAWPDWRKSKSSIREVLTFSRGLCEIVTYEECLDGLRAYIVGAYQRHYLPAVSCNSERMQRLSRQYFLEVSGNLCSQHNGGVGSERNKGSGTRCAAGWHADRESDAGVQSVRNDKWKALFCFRQTD